MNGPINVVRLERKDKVLYLLFDIHLNVHRQSWCRQTHTLDVHEYLERAFAHTTEPLDFFIEAGEYIMDDEPEKLYSRSNYMSTTQQWVSQAIEEKRHAPNVRYHFMDIRDYFDNLEPHTDTDIDLEAFAGKFKTILTSLQDLIQGAYEQKPSGLYVSRKDQKQMHVVSKLMHKYANKTVQQKIQALIKDKLLHLTELGLTYVERKMDKVRKWLAILEYPSDRFYKKSYGIGFHTQKKLELKTQLFAYRLFNLWLDVFIELTDLFFIRRFLDKDYIKRGILYAGGFHCINIIMILVRYFGFKITHGHYLSMDPPRLTRYMRNTEKADVYSLMRHLYPEELVQCTPMETFPLHFS